MILDRLQRIRERAYALWERAGGGHGHDEAHWRQASDDIDAEDASAAAPRKTKARRAAAKIPAPAKTSAPAKVTAKKTAVRKKPTPSKAAPSTGAVATTSKTRAASVHQEQPSENVVTPPKAKRGRKAAEDVTAIVAAPKAKAGARTPATSGRSGTRKTAKS